MCMSKEHRQSIVGGESLFLGYKSEMIRPFSDDTFKRNCLTLANCRKKTLAYFQSALNEGMIKPTKPLMMKRDAYVVHLAVKGVFPKEAKILIER